MNKKLALIPASLLLASAVALTGCGSGQTTEPSASPKDYSATHEKLQKVVDGAKAAADRLLESETPTP